MTLKKIVMTLGAAAIITASAAAPTQAGTAYQGQSGAPLNNAPLSGYTVSDGVVCYTGSRTWVVPVPVPTSGGTVTRNISADFGNMTAAQAWSFNSVGTAFSGVNFSGSQTAAINVPANGTVFGKFIGHSTLNSCVRTVIFVS